MPKLIHIAFSDLHLHSFTAFAKSKYERFNIRLEVLHHIVEVAHKNLVPILFGGDLFHDPKELTNHVISSTEAYFKNYVNNSVFNNEFICISGNHDQSEKNTKANQSPSYVRGFDQVFEKVILLDYRKYYQLNGRYYFGIPYLNDDDYFFKQVKKANKLAGIKGDSILLIHTDLPGCKTPSGFEVKDVHGFPDKLDKLFSNFKLVLSGHIHKPTQLSKKIIMMGAPVHQDEGDAGCEMGYWEVYSDYSTKFVPLNDCFPCFVKLKAGEEPNNEKDYFIYPPIEEQLDETVVEFSNKLTNKSLVKKYLKKRGIKSKTKRQLLISLLNEGKND